MKEENTNEQKDRRTPPGEAQPKKLYKFHEGGLISGVCAGLGVYFNIDPTIIRIIFVIAAIISHGVAAIAYLFMMVIIPYAKTPEDFASARGDRVNPFGEERRHTDPDIVNSRAYWKKISKEQTDYWNDFINKIFAPLRRLFQEKSSKQ
jgi:phage shock protein PspC (stress-responsive transcriptional regulator)